MSRQHFGDRPMLIDGELTLGNGDWITSIDPSTEDEIGRVPAATAQDVDRAAKAAARAQKGWGAMTIWDRSSLLKQLAERVRGRAEEVRFMEASDSGNTIANLGNDLFKAANHFDYFCGLATEMKGDTLPGLSDGIHFTQRQPYGVVGRIVPFNHPFMFASANLAAPLVAGNTVVMKTPETSPLSATIIAEICKDVLPRGVVNIISGYGLPAGDAIARHPLIRRIGFTGSIKTGLAIQKAAAESCVKHVSLELGGKNPLLICEDADVEKAAAAAVAGMNFAWAGQSCGSTSRVLVHETLYHAAIDALAEKIAAIRVGDAVDPASQMGPLNSSAHLARVQELVEAGKKEARLIIGGDAPAGAEFKRGFWMAPTLFADVEPLTRIASEEVFGPVMTVQKFSTQEEAILLANSVEYGLTSSVFTQDITAAMTYVREIEAGVVHINGTKMHYVGAPFGGVKNSGLGGEEALEELLSYTESKTVHISL